MRDLGSLTRAFGGDEAIYGYLEQAGLIHAPPKRLAYPTQAVVVTIPAVRVAEYLRV